VSLSRVVYVLSFMFSPVTFRLFPYISR
jgi:hypothetical protein